MATSRRQRKAALKAGKGSGLAVHGKTVAAKKAVVKDHTPVPAIAKNDEMHAKRLKAIVGEPPIPQTHSWRLLKPSARIWLKNYDTCIGLFILPALTIILGTVLARDLQTVDTQTFFGVLLMATGLLWSALNLPASYYFQLQAMRGKEPRIKECYKQGYRFAPRLIGLGALLFLLVLGGLLVLVIPGLIMIRRYILAPFYLIDLNIGVREAMARSAADSKPVAMFIWGTYATYFTINILCIAILSPIFPPLGSIIGGIITSLYAFGPALRYREAGLRLPATQTASD